MERAFYAQNMLKCEARVAEGKEHTKASECLGERFTEIVKV